MTIQSHYAYNNLYEVVLNALGIAGISANNVNRKDITAIDEFHVRGQEVSLELAASAGLQTGMRVLDAGCGLGGACRLLADEFDCEVTGIDITEDYIRTAEKLSKLTGLQNKTSFLHGSVLALPFDDNSFDIVITQHVQMNIADKKTFYSEVARVLKNSGRFVYYDILSTDRLPVQYPVPWAPDESISFLITAQQMHTLLKNVGFNNIQITNETAKGVTFFNNLFNRINQKGLPALGLHLLMGDDAMLKMHNLHSNLIDGRVVLESG
ncbi:MAG TPA: methyltransferase domain-containing protein, partial [Niastella sp.]|nr:methyltransferase domain-containing protein [Niastella sp.]